MTREFEYDVFISHSSKDKPEVLKLANKLKEDGLSVWLDDWVLQAGDDIRINIDEGLEKSQYVLFIMSSNVFINSDWVKNELSVSLFRDPTNRDRNFIPVLLADCEIPDTIRRYKHIDYRNADEEAYKKILNACTAWEKEEEEKGSANNAIQEKRNKLATKFGELGNIFFKVVMNRLKQIEMREPDSDEETLLILIDEFLNANMSASDLKEAWKGTLDNSPQTVELPNYSILGERLSDGGIIPFLGADISELTDPPLPSLEDLTGRLAEEAEYSGFDGPLTMISQYFQMTEYGRKKMVQTVKENVKFSTETAKINPLFVMLAKIKEPILIITSSYNTLLEDTFPENKKFVVMSHLITENSAGNIVLKYSDTKEEEKTFLAEQISGLKLIENGYSIIYKVCGCLGISSDENDALLISEEDFFSFARTEKVIIPDYIHTYIKNRSLLFIKNNLNRWQERLVLNAILDKKRTSKKVLSFAVSDSTEKYEEAFWKFNDVTQYKVDLNAFVSEIEKKIV